MDLHPRCNGLLKSLSDKTQSDTTSTSEKLAILSFFEDSDIQIRTEDGVELPLWCGTMSFDLRNGLAPRAGLDIKYAIVMATMPSASWHPSRLREWKKIIDHSSFMLPLSRRTIPPPPLVRLRGINAKNAAVISRVVEYINVQGKVINLGPFMGAVIMSRKQALERINTALGQLNCRLKNMWPLAYYTSKTGQITKIQDEISVPEEDCLFAFMNEHNEDLEYFGNRGNALDISSLARDVIGIMHLHRILSDIYV